MHLYKIDIQNSICEKYKLHTLFTTTGLCPLGKVIVGDTNPFFISGQVPHVQYPLQYIRAMTNASANYSVIYHLLSKLLIYL